MSRRAYDAIVGAEVVVGYDVYLDLIRELLGEQKIIGTGMTQEIDRCQAAVEEALAGKAVAVISSGDAGIYGMAGLVLELVMKYPPLVRPEVAIVPGISAISAAAAVLGAPLMHDFAVISLSDLLTPWEVIKNRIEAAAAGDFVVALYNPKSRRRVSQIEKVREIMLEHRPAATPVGIVHHATRANQGMVLSDLEHFTKEHIDMFSLVIIGNSQTYILEGRMITPRGYTL
ncbi:MAG: precorrin-3B C(17)-methyltransferase [Negativicutes bacterium]|nr:precorrin-3B C(17)-methyltransferase [Negativicutes bacterium]